MAKKTFEPNFGTGIAIGMPFFVLGIVQENVAFFLIGIALALSLGASFKSDSSNEKE
ncbi:hypothetical protein HU147_00555 [Planomicrobium chinense]|uniref:hypothetical protein n=1 Tax=Planococcus chinensis TaxID=272917 RepID=UPI001CC43747|nr:hypothetical protein [Planococcus chinensis]MBZ5199692.1 hypothetical protein [Planococcus chinensis]MCP2034375.1 hypothetical protein [Planomicrobium sp. HSC-17F08]